MLLSEARLGDCVVDVRIEGGVIREIGDLGGGGVPLGGRWLLPGLWDEHVHLTQWAASRRRIDLSAAASAADAARLVADAAATSAGTVVGRDFRDALWPDRPTAAVLDAVVADRDVVLVSADLHSCWLNSRALARFGHTGSDGLLREEDCFSVVRRLDEVPVEESDAWVADAAAAAAARGVVGVVDLEMAWNIDVWLRRRDAGFAALRVDVGVYPPHLQLAGDRGLRTGLPLDELITVGPAKIITDGSLNTRTAYCVHPYPGETEHPYGLLTVPPDELERWLRAAHEMGMTPAVHAIGDEANRLALDAFQTVGCPGRIEHAQLLRWEDLSRFRELGVVASVQPEHAMDDRDVAERHWAGRTDRAFPLRSLLESGVELRFGSDAPVAPLDPWVTIAAAVGRTRGDRAPWHPEQTIGVSDALAASARTRVEVGQPADVCVVERDPWAASPEELRTMPVALTVLAGRVTHDAL
ncbi:hypothetical protein CLV46_1476 [Diaminobutyricimonas aerilata]|uniref:Amidohydrolase 3 domain-containing protein n=1 Tax=Diaminobutyricimonas aerilata TaxID=1162967 RepID=A0A2M9CJ52_9MICO|nr:amidohydrolase family protein [Diaminobutyricimonas aerilata]PJJ71920.1 hypothetical protein CLV46_1476 [Diaminobutyricimonas aerilata]